MPGNQYGFQTIQPETRTESRNWHNLSIRAKRIPDQAARVRFDLSGICEGKRNAAEHGQGLVARSV